MSDSEDYWAEVARKNARRRRVIRTLAVVLAGSYALWFAASHLPQWLVKQGHHAAVDCFNDSWEHANVDPKTCVEHERRWIFLAKVWPWTRKEAKYNEALDRFEGYGYALEDAVATHPDAGARKVALDGLFEAAKDPALAENAVVIASLAKGFLAGAFEELSTHDAGDAGHDAWDYVLESAIVVGDVEAIKRVARVERPDKYAWSFDLQRGAWLCLLGDRPSGLKALALADKEYREAITSSYEGWLNARLSIVACGGTEADVGFDPRRVGEFEQHEMDALIASTDPSKPISGEAYLVEHRSGSIMEGADRLPFVALAIVEKAHDPEQLLPLIDSGNYREGAVVTPHLEAFLTPGVVLHAESGMFGDQPYAVAIEPLEHAATILEAAATSAKESYPAPKEEDYSDLDYSGHRKELRAHPKKYLRNAAWAMWFAASVEWARRGERERAHAAIDHAMALTAEGELLTRVLSAGIYLTVGDHARVLEIDRPIIAGPYADASHGGDRMVLEMQCALALAGLGKFDEAYDAAKRAHDLGAAEPKGDAMETFLNDLAWLHAALGLKVGKVDEVAAPEGAPLLSEPLAPWLARAKLPEEQRKVSRRQDFSMPTASRMVAAAYFFVVGTSAEGAGDVEVWLDHVFASSMARGGRAEMLARAEAARWRGDAKAAEKWESRAKTLVSYVHDHGTSLLASAAGF